MLAQMDRKKTRSRIRRRIRKKLAGTGRFLALIAPSRAVCQVLHSMRVQDFFFTADSALEAWQAFESSQAEPSALGEKAPALEAH